MWTDTYTELFYAIIPACLFSYFFGVLLSLHRSSNTFNVFYTCKGLASYMLPVFEILRDFERFFVLAYIACPLYPYI